MPHFTGHFTPAFFLQCLERIFIARINTLSGNRNVDKLQQCACNGKRHAHEVTRVPLEIQFFDLVAAGDRDLQDISAASRFDCAYPIDWGDLDLSNNRILGKSEQSPLIDQDVFAQAVIIVTDK